MGPDAWLRAAASSLSGPWCVREVAWPAPTPGVSCGPVHAPSHLAWQEWELKNGT